MSKLSLRVNANLNKINLPTRAKSEEKNKLIQSCLKWVETLRWIMFSHICQTTCLVENRMLDTGHQCYIPEQ